MEGTFLGNFHLRTRSLKRPYVGIIQIRLMGRRSYLPRCLIMKSLYTLSIKHQEETMYSQITD